MSDLLIILWTIVGVSIVVILLRTVKSSLLYAFMVVVGIFLATGYQQIEIFIGTIKKSDAVLVAGSLIIVFGYLGLSLNVYSNEPDALKYKSLYPDKKLLQKRKEDLKEVVKNLRKFPILGITADWGLGKSVLVDKLLTHKQKNNWQIICIDALRFNSEQLVGVVLTELQNAAWQNKKIETNIYGVLGEVNLPWYLEGIMRFFGFVKPPSVRLEKFAEALNKLNKWILINYEDLDRITNADVLRQLLALNELLTRKIAKLKIIYQYDPNKLTQLGLEQEYLEKYISHTVPLSKLGFSEIVEQVLEDNPDIKEKIGGELMALGRRVKDSEIQLSKKDNSGKEVKIVVPRIRPKTYSYRLIESFILECSTVLHKGKMYSATKKSIAIRVLYLRHLLPELYQLFGQLSPGFNSCQNIFRYKIKNKNDSVYLGYLINRNSDIWNQEELLMSEKDFSKAVSGILSDGYNHKVFNLLNFLGYYQEGYVDTRAERQKVEEIDRVVCNIVAPASCFYTDDENVYVRVVNALMSGGDIGCYNDILKFRDELRHFDYEKGDNCTIDFVGYEFYSSVIISISAVLQRRPELDNKELRLKILHHFSWYMKNMSDMDTRGKAVLDAFSFYRVKYFEEVEIITDLFYKYCEGVTLPIIPFLRFIDSMVNSLIDMGYMQSYWNFSWDRRSVDLTGSEEAIPEILKSLDSRLEELLAKEDNQRDAIISTFSSLKDSDFEDVIHSQYDRVKDFIVSIRSIIMTGKFELGNGGEISVGAGSPYSQYVQNLLNVIHSKGKEEIGMVLVEDFKSGKFSLKDLAELSNALVDEEDKEKKENE
jgi:hypothetical protein